MHPLLAEEQLKERPLLDVVRIHSVQDPLHHLGLPHTLRRKLSLHFDGRLGKNVFASAAGHAWGRVGCAAEPYLGLGSPEKADRVAPSSRSVVMRTVSSGREKGSVGYLA